MFHRSDRLLLRPGWIEDAPEVTACIADEAVVRNLAAAPWPYGEDDARAWLAMPARPRHPEFLLTLPGADGSTVIGACGIRAATGAPELGYWIARPWWGRGFATEAVRAVVAIARTLGHARLRARHALDNPASGRVLRKAGFVPTGSVTLRACAARGENVPAREYEAVLTVQAGDNDPSRLPHAA